jgi:hypothetical protein
MPLSSERISLVDFATREGIERLEAAIQLADVIKTVDTQVKYVFFTFFFIFLSDTV